MAHSQIEDEIRGNGVWFLDSGCSNHMSGEKSLFKKLDETQKGEVRLGDNKQMQVEGKGIIAIKTLQGDVKLLYDVQYMKRYNKQMVENKININSLRFNNINDFFRY
jgi:Pol polyprotein